jgi:hypothetical protein
MSGVSADLKQEPATLSQLLEIASDPARYRAIVDAIETARRRTAEVEIREDAVTAREQEAARVLAECNAKTKRYDKFWDEMKEILDEKPL